MIYVSDETFCENAQYNSIAIRQCVLKIITYISAREFFGKTFRFTLYSESIISGKAFLK